MFKSWKSQAFSSFLVAQLALGPIALAQEPAKQPTKPAPETPLQQHVGAIEEQLNPPTPSTSLAKGAETLSKQRKELKDKAAQARGTTSKERIENKNTEVVRSHESFYTDWMHQSRYFYPLMTGLLAEAAGITTYQVLVRKARTFWLPKFEASAKLKEGMSNFAAQLKLAEDEYLDALAKNWNEMGVSERVAAKGALSRELHERLMTTLGDIALEARVNPKPPVDAAQKQALGEAVEKSFKRLVRNVRDYIASAQKQIPEIEAAITDNLALQKLSPAQRAEKAVSLSTAFKNELEKLSELDGALIEVDELKKVSSINPSFMRSQVDAFDKAVESLHTEAGLKAGKVKPKFFSFRKHTGWMVLVLTTGLVVTNYAWQRNSNMEAEFQKNLAVANNNDDREHMRETQDSALSAARMRYVQFYKAWRKNAELGKTAYSWPLTAPSNDGVAMDDSNLADFFYPLCTVAAFELQEEMDRFNSGVPEAEAKLTYEERLNRKIWTGFFRTLREEKKEPLALRGKPWQSIGIEKKDDKSAPPRGLETEFHSIQDFIQSLAYSVTYDPSPAPRKEPTAPPASNQTAPGTPAAPDTTTPQTPAEEPMVPAGDEVKEDKDAAAEKGEMEETPAEDAALPKEELPPSKEETPKPEAEMQEPPPAKEENPKEPVPPAVVEEPKAEAPEKGEPPAEVKKPEAEQPAPEAPPPATPEE